MADRPAGTPGRRRSPSARASRPHRPSAHGRRRPAHRRLSAAGASLAHPRPGRSTCCRGRRGRGHPAHRREHNDDAGVCADPTANGSITITLNQLTTGIPALNAKLHELGIDETVIPIKTGCHSPDGSGPLVMQPNPMFEDQRSVSMTFTPRAAQQHPPSSGFHYVLAAKRLPNGKILAFIGASKRPSPAACRTAAHRHRSRKGRPASNEREARTNSPGSEMRPRGCPTGCTTD